MDAAEQLRRLVAEINALADIPSERRGIRPPRQPEERRRRVGVEGELDPEVREMFRRSSQFASDLNRVNKSRSER